jgi:hypothetical protein
LSFFALPASGAFSSARCWFGLFAAADAVAEAPGLA